MATSGSVSTSKYQGRYYTVSWTATQDVGTNKSTVKWTLKAVGGSASWYAERTLKVNVTSDNTLSGTTSYSKSSRVERYAGTIKSGTFTVAHDNNGNASFTIKVQVAVYTSSVNCTGSQKFTLTTIPRKSTLTVANGTLGTAQTLTVTRMSTNFTHTITAKCGNASVTLTTKSTSASIPFTPPVDWANQNTAGTSLTVVYTITTYSGTTVIGNNTYTKTCTIPTSATVSGVTYSFVPKCSVAVTDSMGYEEIYGAFIKGLSKFKVVVTPTTAYGSAIASYSTTANGSTYTEASFTTGVLASSGTLTVKATVKDKRGRSGSASKELTVLNYTSPKVSNLTVGRCNADGTENNEGGYVKVTFSGSVTSLNSNNSASYVVKYKNTSETTFPDDQTKTFDEYANVYSVTDASYIFEADTGSSYDVQIEVTDDFNTTPKSTSVSTAFTLMHWKSNGLGMAFGKISELDNVLDIGFMTRFLGGILQPVLKEGTDFDTVKNPNTYTLKSAQNANYLHCPTLSSTGKLTVEECGEEGQLRQVVTSCDKKNPITYERFYYENAWGEWICTNGDYVVTQGTSGIWTYRKWNSGIAECWGRTPKKSSVSVGAWGSIFSADNAIASVALPFTFTEIPVFQATPVKYDSNYWLFTNLEGNATKTPVYGIARGSSNTLSCSVDFYVIGKWK